MKNNESFGTRFKEGVKDVIKGGLLIMLGVAAFPAAVDFAIGPWREVGCVSNAVNGVLAV